MILQYLACDLREYLQNAKKVIVVALTLVWFSPSGEGAMIQVRVP